MKSEHFIQTPIGELETPRHCNVKIKKCDDLGSNMIEAYRANGSFVRQQFKGYESQGRQQFTREEVEAFIKGVYENNVNDFLVLLIGEDLK